ncbi:MAG: hypothetical protein IJA61_03520 [Clostridia bacterium]|nr:hypothetical protein [Clostridia bacterium]
MQNILERLKSFSLKQNNNHISITIPLVIVTDGGLLDLIIEQIDNGYKIYCPRDFFSEANGSQEFYYSIFENKDKSYHYEMKIQDNIIYKEFSNEYNIVVALSEVIRFFVLFDDFIINNGVVGNEEDFAN